MLLVKRILAALFGLVPLLLIGVGVVMVLREVLPPEPSLYSVRQDRVINHAVMYAAVGCLGLVGCHRLWQADAGWKWILVPVAVVVLAVAIPNFEYWHHGSPLNRASFSTIQRLGMFADSSTQLAKEQGRFTCDTSTDLLGPSRFMQRGQPLPYVLQCVLNATGPPLAGPPERPGTLLFAISPDRTQAWFTATVLAREPDRHATWLTRQGQPVVIATQLQPKS